MSRTLTQPASSRRLAEYLRGLIQDGDWQIGSTLPSTRQIARRHRVSVNTVQRALSQLEAMDLIECQPRRKGVVKAARPGTPPGTPPGTAPIAAPATQIGLLIPQILTSFAGTESWCGHISEGARRRVAEAGYDLTILTPRTGHVELEAALLERMASLRPALAGVLGFQMQQFPRLRLQMEQWDLPLVCINRPAPAALHNFVSTDFSKGGYTVGRCFAAMPVQRVLLLWSDMTKFRSAMEENAGFMQAWLENGRDATCVHMICCADSAQELGHEQMRTYLRGHEPPQAIFAVGDRLALGAIRACQEAGLRVPEDVSVVGGTGLDLSRHTSPSLAVVQQPMAQVGQTAADMLLDLIGATSTRLPGVLLPPTFVARQSLRLPDAVAGQWICDAVAP